jgi:calcium-dependent protein kinase
LEPKKSVSLVNLKFNVKDFVGQNENKISSEYKILEKIGKGGFSEVRKVLHMASNQIRAIKKIAKKDLSILGKKKLFREIEILKNLDHPNIVKIHEFFENSFYIHIVLDYIPGKELFEQIVSTNMLLTENNIRKIMKQIISTVNYLHNLNIVHRDLKSENILFDGKNITIIDFGTSTHMIEESLSKFTGTILYIAPEVINKNYNEKCDIWSCGVILYILLTGKPPYEGTNEELKTKILNSDFSTPIKKIEDISEKSRQLLNELLEKDYTKRKSAGEILKLPFFTEFDEKESFVQNDKIFDNLMNFHFRDKLQEAIYLYLLNALLTQEEQTEIINHFQLMDENNDGFLSKQELKDGFKKMGKDFTEEEIEKMYDEIDLDGNGKISYSEFLAAAIDKENFLSDERIMKVFKMVDTDKNGKLSIEELESVFKNNKDFLKGDWDELMSEADLNGDGEIDFKEFKILLLKLIKIK